MFLVILAMNLKRCIHEFKKLESKYIKIEALEQKIRTLSLTEWEEEFRQLELDGKEPENNRQDDLPIGCFCF